ncbi:hypothetical protein EC844_12561 [Acinetobacter calcoaceticus]|uniref:Uncharacterized protein n=1 Tax=Acinetobacter calcoaceticus TaxID=471 RepID=A0A4R1XRN3_ACICA|nr:hypothetical protein EC844_12561 [Acinetobacter calcoaceticus]
MKKRNKKYVPLAQKMQRQMASKLGLTYEFEMEFEIEVVNKAINEWRERYNVAEDEYCPEWVTIDTYQQQDLIIALKMQQLQDPTYWEIGIDSHFYDAELGKVHTIPFSVELPEMSHADLMNGCEVKVNRGGGLKTRWKGLQTEMIANWETEDLTGLELIKSQVFIKAEAKFKSAQMLKEFEYMISARDRGVLVQQLRNFGRAAA